MPDLSRRMILEATGAIGATICTPMPLEDAKVRERRTVLIPAASPPGATAPHQARATTYLFFNMEEAAFIEAAVSRLIPADEEWAGALEAGVPNYMDKQLAGAWGAGERLYRGGPWQQGTPSQGYQLPFTPAELFHTALRAIIRDMEKRGPA